MHEAITGHWWLMQDTRYLSCFLRMYLIVNLQEILKNSGRSLQQDTHDFLVIINFKSFYTDRKDKQNDVNLLEILR